ncbi:MAG: hypothetical protein BWK80_08710 [Desulfobacteraceae bacterium IS3]|nr:MAG: hypothetical protein BWK80_08710 [Desulfobacteraceae bacterium IS3]HAO22722.1 hypothetical protein [Desulfobacteraceae bacterium]
MNKKPDNQRFRGMGTWFLLMSVFIVQLLFYTWCRVQCTQVGYEVSKEASRYQRLLTFQNHLKVELASLKSPERLASIATARLGLINPSSEQVVILP